MATRLRPNYDLPDHRTGDTFRAIECTLKVNGDPVDLTDATILCQVRSTPGGTLAMALQTSIPFPTMGIFRIDEQAVTLTSGLYYYDLQITMPSGFKQTYMTGTWSILQDISRE